MLCATVMLYLCKCGWGQKGQKQSCGGSCGLPLMLPLDPATLPESPDRWLGEGPWCWDFMPRVLPPRLSSLCVSCSQVSPAIPQGQLPCQLQDTNTHNGLLSGSRKLTGFHQGLPEGQNTPIWTGTFPRVLSSVSRGWSWSMAPESTYRSGKEPAWEGGCLSPYGTDGNPSKLRTLPEKCALFIHFFPQDH